MMGTFLYFWKHSLLKGFSDLFLQINMLDGKHIQVPILPF